MRNGDNKIMINRYGNESLIWGLDYYNAGVNESLNEYWLSYENSEFKLLLDKFSDLDLGLPNESHSISNNPNGYNKFIGKSEYSEREISFSTFFDGSKKQERAELISYFTGKSEKLYFYHHIPYLFKTYRIEVKPSISGEKYSSLKLADKVKIILTCKDSFFESVDYTEHEINIPNENVKAFEIENAGFDTSFELIVKPNTALTEFQLVHQNGNAFQVSFFSEIASNQIIKINSGTGEISVDGIIQDFGFSKGATFELVQGVNKLSFQGSKCDIEIRYKEKAK